MLTQLLGDRIDVHLRNRRITDKIMRHTICYYGANNMSQVDFTALLVTSSSERPDHVPVDYIRVDHWGAEF